MQNYGAQSQKIHRQHTVSVLKAWGLFQKRSREIVRGRGAESLLSDFCLQEMSKATAHKVSPAQLSKHELNKDINRHVQVEGQKPTGPQPYTRSPRQLINGGGSEISNNK